MTYQHPDKIDVYAAALQSDIRAGAPPDTLREAGAVAGGAA